MLPSIHPGDVLTVRNQAARNLSVGEIILAQCGRGLVAHRIVGRRGSALVTRGDSLSQNDPPVNEEEVLGRIVGVTRDGRPVNLKLTPAQRLARAVLRRSDLSVRVLMRWKRRG